MRDIIAQPGYVAGDTDTVFASGQFVFAECFTITPLVGSPMYFTTAQQDVTVVPVSGGPGRITYLARALVINGLKLKTSRGSAIDEQEITIGYANDALYQNYTPWPLALKNGLLDGAYIRRDRYVAASWGSPWVGGMAMFLGKVSTLDSVGALTARIKIKSDMVLLGVMMPRDTYHPLCKNTWGDVACGLNPSTYAVQATIGASPTRSYLPWSASTIEFAMGKIHITNSDSVTRVRTILSATTSGITLIYPLDFDPVAGLQFTAFPNCRREYGRCGLYRPTPSQSFAGFPAIPVAETAS